MAKVPCRRHLVRTELRKLFEIDEAAMTGRCCGSSWLIVVNTWKLWGKQHQTSILKEISGIILGTMIFGEGRQYKSGFWFGKYTVYCNLPTVIGPPASFALLAVWSCGGFVNLGTAKSTKTSYLMLFVVANPVVFGGTQVEFGNTRI